LGYNFYQERQKTAGIEINIGKNGVSIEKKWSAIPGMAPSIVA
jgi:hypothetical protein